MKIYVLELISSDLNDNPEKQYISGIIDIFKTKKEAPKGFLFDNARNKTSIL